MPEEDGYGRAEEMTVGGNRYIAVSTGPRRWKIGTLLPRNDDCNLLQALRADGYWIDAWQESRDNIRASKMLTVEFSLHDIPEPCAPVNEKDIVLANKRANEELYRKKLQRLDEQIVTAVTGISPSGLGVPSGTVSVVANVQQELKPVIPESDYMTLRKQFILYGGNGDESLIAAKDRLIEKVTGTQDAGGEWHWDPDPATPLWDPPMRKTVAMKLSKEEYLLGKRRSPVLAGVNALCALICMLVGVIFLMSPHPVAGLPELGASLILCWRVMANTRRVLPPRP